MSHAHRRMLRRLPYYRLVNRAIAESMNAMAKHHRRMIENATGSDVSLWPHSRLINALVAGRSNRPTYDEIIAESEKVRSL